MWFRKKGEGQENNKEISTGTTVICEIMIVDRHFTSCFTTMGLFPINRDTTCCCCTRACCAPSLYMYYSCRHTGEARRRQLQKCYHELLSSRLFFFFLSLPSLVGSSFSISFSSSRRLRFRFSSTVAVAVSLGATNASARSARRFAVASVCCTTPQHVIGGFNVDTSQKNMPFVSAPAPHAAFSPSV